MGKALAVAAGAWVVRWCWPYLKTPRKPLPSGMGRNRSALTNMGAILTGLSIIL